MRDERGAIALEGLLVLPLVALLLVATLGAVGVLVDHLGVHRAAHAAVRAVALSGDPARGRSVGLATLPGAAVSATVSAGVATVDVRIRQRLLGVSYEAAASASAPLEPVAR